MTTSIYQTANALAALAPGTWPKTEYLASVDYEAAPATFDDTDVVDLPQTIAAGIGLPDNTIVALVGVDVREDIARRTARVSIADFDGTREYTISIDGTSVTTTAQPYADTGAALEEIKAEIDGDGTLSLLVTTSVIDADGDGNDDTLVISGIGEADFAVDALSASAGSAVLDLVADASSLDFALYVVRGGVNTSGNPRPNGWRKIPLSGGVSVVGVDTEGYEERYDVSGLRRIAARVTNVAEPGDVAAGSSVNSVTHTYAVHVGYGVNPGST